MESARNRPAEVKKGIDFWRKVEHSGGKFRKMRIPSSMFEPREGIHYGYIELKHWKENSVWAVRIQQYDSGLFMKKGLNRFCRHFNVNHGSILWFEYEGGNKFLVKVGGRNGITYNPKLETMATATHAQPGSQMNQSKSFVAYLHSDSIVVPNELVQSWCLEDDRDCRLKMSNSLDFALKFNAMERKIEGVEKILSVVAINKFWPVLIDYTDLNCFTLTLFSDDGFQCDPSTVKESMDSHIEDGRVEDQQICDCRDYATLAVFGQTYARQPVFYEINENSIRRLTNRNKGDRKGFDIGDENLSSGTLWMTMGFRSYPFIFEYRNGEFCFVRGWTNFYNKNKLRIGEILVVQPKEESLMFETCVIQAFPVKREEESMTAMMEGLISSPLTFICGINYYSLHTGKIAIPFAFSVKTGVSVPRDCICVVSDGFSVPVKHSENQRVLLGLRSLFSDNKIEHSDIVVFSYMGNGVFKLRAFKKRGMEILLKTNTQRSEIMTKRKERANDSQVSANNPRSDEPKKAKIMTEEGTSQVGGVESVQPDLQQSSSTNRLKWEIIIKPSHLDRVVHGVRVSTVYKNITKSWKNRDIITVNCTTGPINMEVRRNDGSITIHAGWNKFVEMMKPRKGDRCIFTCNEIEKKYEVQILPADDK
ncbi:hypothetical protein ACET3Z_010173 [Daucus carota]